MNALSRVQRNIWLLAAIPTSMAMIQASPLWALPAVCLAAVLYYIVCDAIPADSGLAVCLPKWLLVLELCFLLLVIGKTAARIEGCWQKGNAVLFALVLITLASAASGQGTAAAGRVASGLGLVTLAIMVVVLAAAAPEVRPDSNVGSWMEGFSIFSSATLPLCALFLPGAKLPKETKFWAGIFGSAILVLYCAVSGRGTIPLLYTIRGLALFGFFRRFEAIAACLLTAGLFLILTLFFCSGREIAAELQGKGRLERIFYPASIVAFFLDAYVPDVLIRYGAPIFWGILPVLTLLIVPQKEPEKRFKKSEKRC